MTDHKTPPPVPLGFKRREEDQVLEAVPGPYPIVDPGEAIMGWFAGKRRFQCTKDIFVLGRRPQCSNVARYDPDWQGNPTRCGVHCASAVDRRAAESEARRAKECAIVDRQNAIRVLERELHQIVQEIADGHSDPQSLCRDWLYRMAELRGFT